MSLDLKAYSKEIHKQVKKPTETRQVVTTGIDEIWSIDLSDMGELAEQNKGYKWLMVVIDCFSRFVWCEPMKDKTAESSWAAFQLILKKGRKPEKLWSDQGKEFYNSVWKGHLDALGISQYSTYSLNKASIVERVQRTLKTKMWVIFTEKQTRNWVKILPELVSDYNNTVHSSIKKTPTEASLKSGENKLLEQYAEPEEGKAKYKVGQWVRISRIKDTFEKGYTPSWSFEIFQITSISLKKPVVYYLHDYYGEAVKGAFYQAEIQPTKQKDVFLVEKVLETKGVGKKKENLVKFVGYVKPRWMKSDEMVDLGIKK